MKKLSLAIILITQTILSCTQAQTQTQAKTQVQSKDKEKEQSNAEIFSERAGILIQKEFENIGIVKKCEIQIARFTDVVTGQKTNAVRFSYDYVSSYSSDTKLALLDADEIDGLIKSIRLIQDKVFPTTPSNYTEVSFKSRSGFEAGCFSNKKEWSAYMKIEKFDSKSYVFMSKEDMAVLLSLLEQAKTKL